jgi:hypothetical protein
MTLFRQPMSPDLVQEIQAACDAVASEQAAEQSEAYTLLDDCGSCGCYHRPGWHGDCREDSERFPVPFLPYPGLVWTGRGWSDDPAERDTKEPRGYGA